MDEENVYQSPPFCKSYFTTLLLLLLFLLLLLLLLRSSIILTPDILSQSNSDIVKRIKGI